MPLMVHVFPPTPPPLFKPLFSFIFISHFILPFYESPFSSQVCSTSSPTMAKIRCAHSYRPRVCQNPTPPGGTFTLGATDAAGPSVARPSATAAASPTPAAIQGTAAAADTGGSSSVAPTQMRYHTRVGLTPPAPLHPRPALRAPPPKRAQNSGPWESSTSRPRAPPSPPYKGIVGAPDLSPASIIRRPYFPCIPISGNVDCRGRDFDGEVYYDFPSFSADPELRDSMLLL